MAVSQHSGVESIEEALSERGDHLVVYLFSLLTGRAEGRVVVVAVVERKRGGRSESYEEEDRAIGIESVI